MNHSQKSELVRMENLSPTIRLTGIALFAALSILLTVVFKGIPDPLANFLYFEVWEIPIVIVFLAFGWDSGVYVSLINTSVLLIYFQGSLGAGPIYNLAAVLSMLVGVGLGHKFALKAGARQGLVVSTAVGLGILARVSVMSLVNALVLPLGPPFGFYIPFDAVVRGYLPPIGVFNAIVALYTVLIAYSALRVVASRYRIVPAFNFLRPAMLQQQEQK